MKKMSYKEYRMLPKKRRNKYGAKKVKIDGYTFDSKKEAKRYGQLKLLEKAGKIEALHQQTKFELFAAELSVEGNDVCGKKKVSAYVADFSYYKKGRLVVEDCKSKPTKTPLYKLKKAIFEANYGIKITEVM